MAHGPAASTLPGDPSAIRRGMADIVALAALPSAWSGMSRAAIARDLADVLVRIVQPSAVVVTLVSPNREEPIEAAWADSSPAAADVCARLRPRLAEWVLSEPVRRVVPPSLSTDGLSVVTMPIGVYGDLGVLAVAAGNGFPRDVDRAVLSVAANMAAHAIQARAAEEERQRAEEALRRATDEQRIADTLQHIGTTLVAELDRERIVQAATDAATAVTGAQFGAFFYNVVDTAGESYMLYTLSGVPREAFARFPMPRNTQVFGPTFRGEEIVRIDDVTADPRYGHNAPYRGMPPGHLPVRSYLAVPVFSRTRTVLGGLFFGHSEPRRFTERHERLAAGVAGWAGLAIDNGSLYREAQQANKAKDEFLATLSHELRTPLNAITGWVSMLGQADAMGPDTVVKARAALERNTRMLVTLVEDLLDVSRIASGKIQLSLQRVDLAELARDVLRATEPAAVEQRLTVEADLAGPCLVDADPVRMRQVIANLVANAVKFTSAGGTLTIVVRDEAGGPTLTVRDTGIGIPSDLLPYIFERFRQGTDSRASIGGLGLGLAIARNLVELHRGTIEAQSEGIGRGATFTVRLPRGGAAEGGASPSH